MGKYHLKGPGIGEEIESGYLPREGEEYLHWGTVYYVESVRHKTVQKGSRLETEVEVCIKK